MTKGFSLFLFLVFSFSISFSQNLLDNGDFEKYSILPTGYGQWDRAIGWNNVNMYTVYSTPQYTKPLGGVPDYYNLDGASMPYYNFIPPISGKAQMGFYMYHDDDDDDGDEEDSTNREYISTKLNSPMDPGKEYTVSFYLRNANKLFSLIGCNNLGIKFSTKPLHQSHWEPIITSPQIEITSVINHNEWRLYSFSFIPDSSYEYLTMGNFHYDHNTTLEFNITGPEVYFYVDNIKVTTPFYVTASQSEICLGDSALLVAHGDVSYEWTIQDNSAIISTNDSIIVKPDQTTTYVAKGLISSSNYKIKVNPLPLLELGKDTVLCEGKTLVLNAYSSSQNRKYLWQNNDSSSSTLIKKPGVYWVLVSENNCTSIDSINVSFHPLPIIEMDADTTICYGDSIYFNGNSIYSYLWNDGSIANVRRLYPAQKYTVIVKDSLCSNAKDLILKRKCCENFIAPNLITPNLDSKNDFFEIKCVEMGWSFIVFNQWGEKVYESKSYRNEWNGEELSGGIYFYELKNSENEERIKGWLHIIK